MNRYDLRRLEKAVKEKDKRYIFEWGKEFEEQMRIEFNKAYQDEIASSIENALTAVAYTVHYSELTKLSKYDLTEFMQDLFVTLDMFRTRRI